MRQDLWKDLFTGLIDAVHNNKLLNILGYPLAWTGFGDSKALSFVERLFPLYPERRLASVFTIEEFYDLQDSGDELGERVLAVLTFDLDAISYYRWREKYRRELCKLN